MPCPRHRWSSKAAYWQRATRLPSARRRSRERHPESAPPPSLARTLEPPRLVPRNLRRSLLLPGPRRASASAHPRRRQTRARDLPPHRDGRTHWQLGRWTRWRRRGPPATAHRQPRTDRDRRDRLLRSGRAGKRVQAPSLPPPVRPSARLLGGWRTAEGRPRERPKPTPLRPASPTSSPLPPRPPKSAIRRQYPKQSRMTILSRQVGVPMRRSTRQRRGKRPATPRQRPPRTRASEVASRGGGSRGPGPGFR